MGNNRIQRLALFGAASVVVCVFSAAAEGPWRTTASWGSYGRGDYELHWPCAVAVSSSGAVYVADTLNDRVQVFSAAGDYLYTLPCGPAPGIRRPSAVAVSDNGVVYVGDAGNDRVVAFDEANGSAAAWGGYGSAPGRFNGVRGVVFRDGVVFVADSHNRRVQVFDAEGRAAGELPPPPGGFVEPYGLAACDGGVIVTDAGAGIIYYYKTEDNAAYEYDRAMTGPGPRPIAIAALGDDRFVVVDEERDVVHVGPAAAAWTELDAGRLLNPRGVAGGLGGTVYVVDAGADGVTRYLFTP